MTEKELINKLKELRQIEPQADWAVLLKNQILAGEKNKSEQIFSILVNWLRWTLNKSLVPVTISLLLVFLCFGLAQNAMPGDFLYNIKKLTEKSQAVFVSEEELPEFSLEIANKRLAELNKIVEKKQTKNLAPALNEVKNSLAQMTKVLLSLQATSSDATVIDKFVEETTELQNKIEKLKEQGIMVDDEEFIKISQELKCQFLSLLISDLEKRTLTDEQKAQAENIKEMLDENNCQEGLELFLLQFNQKNK